MHKLLCVLVTKSLVKSTFIQIEGKLLQGIRTQQLCIYFWMLNQLKTLLTIYSLCKLMVILSERKLSADRVQYDYIISWPSQQSVAKTTYSSLFYKCNDKGMSCNYKIHIFQFFKAQHIPGAESLSCVVPYGRVSIILKQHFTGMILFTYSDIFFFMGSFNCLVQDGRSAGGITIHPGGKHSSLRCYTNGDLKKLNILFCLHTRAHANICHCLSRLVACSDYWVHRTVLYTSIPQSTVL